MLEKEEDTEQRFSTIEKIGENLFFIIIEITNNDLKYGKETANWQLSFSKKEVSILLESETSFLYSEGFGTNNLQKRVDMLSGSMTQEQVESKFKILVKIPFFERGTSPF